MPALRCQILHLVGGKIPCEVASRWKASADLAPETRARCERRCMSTALEVTCRHCGKTAVLDEAQQTVILAELTRASQRKILECTCGHFQTVLAARTVRQCAA
jgi:hypothetical protein